MKQYKVVFGFMKGEGRGVRFRGVFRCYEAYEVAKLAGRALNIINKDYYPDTEMDLKTMNATVIELEQIVREGE